MVALIIIVVLVAIVIALIVMRNNLVVARQRVKNAWSQIDVQLQRRFDLIPNLVETVKGYMAHESDVLEKVTSLRSSWTNAKTVEDKASIDSSLSSTLKTIMALSENYPDLKANTNFMNLQDELSKIDCTKSIANEKYYEQYIEKFKKYIINHDSIDLYSLSRTQEYKNTGLPNIRWFINHCPDKTVKSNDDLKRWMGLYTRIMTKEECKDIILNMSKCYDRPLMYDDFRGSGYGKVTVGQINKYWGSLNKMKKDLGLEINIESMIDRQISSKEELDNMILDICNFVKSENRNFITTREINERPEWVNITSLHKSCKKILWSKVTRSIIKI